MVTKEQILQELIAAGYVGNESVEILAHSVIDALGICYAFSYDYWAEKSKHSAKFKTVVFRLSSLNPVTPPPRPDDLDKLQTR